MTRAAGRLAAALLLAAAPVLLPATAALPAPVAAADAQDCVGVVVDATRLGGAVRTGCVDGDPSSGLDALRRAGFTYTPRPRDGLVCQVDGVPACTDTTTSTYWSYWWRGPGSDRWTYGHEGAATHDPPPGSTEAWVWQDGGRAEPPAVALTTICPQAAQAGTPSSKPTRSKRRAGSTTSPADPAGGATTQAAGRSEKPRAEQPATPSEPTTPPAPTSSSAATPSSTTSPAPTADDAPTSDSVAAQVSGGGTPPWLGLGAGAALLAALGGAALWRFRSGSP